jgi:hypothetical protein
MAFVPIAIAVPRSSRGRLDGIPFLLHDLSPFERTVARPVPHTIREKVDSKFILGRVRKRIRHQLGGVAVRDVVLMLSFPPAGDEPSVTKPSEPFRGG